jgi:hypothetical protein
VRAIRALHGQPIADLSAAGSARMEERSWERLRPAYLEALGFVPEPDAGSAPFPDHTPAPPALSRP